MLTMTPHDWSEHTKRVLDLALGGATAASAGAAAITLNDVAVFMTIVAAFMSSAWYARRFYVDWRYGKHGE